MKPKTKELVINNHRNTKSIWIGIFLFLLLCLSCTTVDSSKQPLASFGDKVLYLNEIIAQKPPFFSAEDSNLWIKEEVYGWLKEQVFLEEVTKELAPYQSEINSQVEKYREQLSRYYYIDKVLKPSLGADISLQDKEIYYEENKQQFVFGGSFFRGAIVVVPYSKRTLLPHVRAKYYTNESDFFAWAKTKKLSVNDFDKQFIRFSELKLVLPETIFAKLNMSTMKEKTPLTYKLNTEYFVILPLQITKATEPAPFITVEKDIQTILYNQSIDKMIKSYRQSLFEQAQQTQQIKIY